MKTNLQSNGKPAEYNLRVNEVFQDGLPIATGSFLSVCAWCIPNQTLKQIEKVYTVSHGICENCHSQMTKNL